MARANIPYIKVVYTEDIYHEIGWMICNALEHIESIRYTEPRASVEACEEFWLEGGYVKISDNLWMKEKPDEEDK
jgi:hypothetical protein